MSVFSPEELERYNRHLILPEFGLAGQRKLKEGSVLLVGAGGLGSPAALYLAAAGIGRLGIIDYDTVDASNLQRQILYGSSTLGKLKSRSAKIRLQDLNPYIQIETHEIALSSKNALDLFERYDVIADGTDNFPTRYLVNDACVLTGKPNVYASIFRFEGQLSVFNYQGGPCYRCLYSEAPVPGMVPSCAEGGVIGVLPGVLGSMQACEVIKILTGIGKTATGRLLMYDALNLKFRELSLKPDKDCAICGNHPTQTSLIDYEKFCGMADASLKPPAEIDEKEIDVYDLKTRRDRGDNFVLLDVREDFEYDICHIEGSVLIPLGELEERIDELSPDDEYIVMCKVGGRSARAADFMQSNGFHKVKNMQGGIDAWIEVIDDSLAPY